MTLKLKQITLPKENKENLYATYENQLKTRVVFGSKEYQDFYQHYANRIMNTLEKELEDYINCDFLCNDDEDMFPRRCLLTGQWYISEINFEYIDFLSIHTHFLGTDSGYVDDYCSLEVVFYYDEEFDEFMLDGIDCESI